MGETRYIHKTYSEIDGVEVCIQTLQTRKSVKVTITDSHDGMSII